MQFLTSIYQSASNRQCCIVLPEGEDDRVMQASIGAMNQNIASIIVLGDNKVAEKLKDYNIKVINPLTSDKLDDYSVRLYEKRKHKGLSQQQATQQIKNPLNFGAMMVECGDADGMVAGADNTTADVVSCALKIVGMDKSANVVSSFFLMVGNEKSPYFEGVKIFSDCALIVKPNSEQLAEIAIHSARSYENIIGDRASVAMLSFSTAGSAKHENVDVVKQSVEIIKQKDNTIDVDGEMQFDTAFVASVRQQKYPNCKLTQQPNVYIFPNLEAGNIGYKICQRIGGVNAIGPILQGLKKPVNDLSRGCSVEDIKNMIAITASQVK